MAPWATLSEASASEPGRHRQLGSVEPLRGLVCPVMLEAPWSVSRPRPCGRRASGVPFQGWDPYFLSVPHHPLRFDPGKNQEAARAGFLSAQMTRAGEES